MNVSLTPELERFVNGKVGSGRYHSASEVIREGLRLLKQQDEVNEHQLEELRREIQIGIDQDDRGQVSGFTKETLKEIKALGQTAGCRREAKRSMKEPDSLNRPRATCSRFGTRSLQTGPS